MANDATHPTSAEQDAGSTVDSMVEHAQAVGSDAQQLASGGQGLDLLMNVGLTLTVELGRSRMKISDIVNLGSGSVVELQKLASEPVDLLVNDTLFARGEVVVMEDHFAVKITELVENANLPSLA